MLIYDRNQTNIVKQSSINWKQINIKKKNLLFLPVPYISIPPSLEQPPDFPWGPTLPTTSMIILGSMRRLLRSHEQGFALKKRCKEELKVPISGNVFLFQSCLVILGPLHFHLNFRISRQFLHKNYWNFGRYCLKSTDILKFILSLLIP